MTDFRGGDVGREVAVVVVEGDLLAQQGVGLFERAGLDLSGRRKSMPCAAASNSIAITPRVFSAIGPSRRAAKVAMLT